MPDLWRLGGEDDQEIEALPSQFLDQRNSCPPHPILGRIVDAQCVDERIFRKILQVVVRQKECYPSIRKPFFDPLQGPAWLVHISRAKHKDPLAHPPLPGMCDQPRSLSDLSPIQLGLADPKEALCHEHTISHIP